MSTRQRLTGLLALPLLAGLLLPGCAKAEPAAAPTFPTTSASPSPSPSSAAESPAEPTSLTFSGTGFASADAEGVPIVSVLYNDGAEPAVALLVDVIGTEPTVADADPVCTPDLTSYEWPGVLLLDGGGDSGYAVILTGADSGGIRLQVTGGWAIGDDVTAAVAALPTEDVIDKPPVEEVFASFDTTGRAVEGEYNSPIGAMGMIADGILKSVRAPGQWSSFYC
jgi:hypothetical protein